VVGIAIWYRTYSTWTGLAGIHLEDLFVEPDARGNGFGRAFLVALAQIALDRGYARFEWVVLDWNTPAIEFYESLGGRPMGQWTTYRVDGERLAALAAQG
jgi:GNAT superfamily N-acetyltransferase